MTTDDPATAAASAPRCPSCGDPRLEQFHHQAEVPSHSCLLLDDREAARRFPRGDISLSVCHRCGFIANLAFDPALAAYSADYEETQGYSPRFRAFADDLARRWVERHDLVDCHVVEVGCGKAEFLAQLCELGGNRGTGIDPAIVPERLDPAARERIVAVPEYLTADTAHLLADADAVVCRHTLEHIPGTAAFLRLVRASIDPDRCRAVLFEVPDTLRVLDEAAFWDVYYEHCSYFTPGSLARLFRGCGFEVTDVELGFEDQYVLLEATPGAGDAPLPAAAEPPERAVAGAHSFRDRLAAIRSGWRTRLEEHHAAGRRVVIWGAGSKGVAFLTTVGVGEEVACAVDVNPHKQGMFMAGTGHPIVGPDHLRDHPADLVVAMNPVYLAEIRRDLDRLGVDAELCAV